MPMKKITVFLEDEFYELIRGIHDDLGLSFSDVFNSLLYGIVRYSNDIFTAICDDFFTYDENE